MSGATYSYVLLTGADLADREEALRKAYLLISERIGLVIRESRLHETEPWGFESDTRFLNQALLVTSVKRPQEVLDEILQIELEIGRVRNDSQWTSRIIDIDILCAENIIHHTETLTIPHKHLHERDFALKPLCEIVPEWKHPLLQKTYLQLLGEQKGATVEKAS